MSETPQEAYRRMQEETILAAIELYGKQMYRHGQGCKLSRNAWPDVRRAARRLVNQLRLQDTTTPEAPDAQP